MNQNVFSIETETLSTHHPHWGEIGVIPWDSDIFGFNVGTLTVSATPIPYAEKDDFRRALTAWANEHKVEMVGCNPSAIAETSSEESIKEARDVEKTRARDSHTAFFCQSGWIIIEQPLRVTLTGLKTYQFKVGLVSLREANESDREAVEAIARTAFRHGRYCADPFFPADLAQLRYHRWVSNAFAALRAGDRATKIYLLGEGKVEGFMHVSVENGVADLRLAAVDSAIASSRAGFTLYLSTLKSLQEMGVGRVTSKIAASNIAVLKLYSALGFRFSDPEWVFHWHAPDAPNLLPEK